MPVLSLPAHLQQLSGSRFRAEFRCKHSKQKHHVLQEGVAEICKLLVRPGQRQVKRLRQVGDVDREMRVRAPAPLVQQLCGQLEVPSWCSERSVTSSSLLEQLLDSSSPGALAPYLGAAEAGERAALQRVCDYEGLQQGSGQPLPPEVLHWLPEHTHTCKGTVTRGCIAGTSCVAAMPLSPSKLASCTLLRSIPASRAKVSRSAWVAAAAWHRQPCRLV